MKRRDFIKGSIATAITAQNVIGQTTTGKPVVISSGNGIEAVRKAYTMIVNGDDAINAVISGVNLVENDPKDHSVGLGGLPNEEGIVELDSCCMHGPTHNAGAVAALQNIKNPSSVAKVVMERTDHVLIVGKGALNFAKRHGFREEDLLTDEARKIWLRWRETLSEKDDWFPPDESDTLMQSVMEQRSHYGTISCCGLDQRGGLSGVTTTSGLAFKIGGRVGDSPIIGAGLYVDNEVGACGSTGRGEENIKNASCFMVVEYMRMGKSPVEACQLVCKRIVDHAFARGLKTDTGRPTFNVSFYAINKNGQYGAASIIGARNFCVCDANGARTEKTVFLYERA
jgi:N4-(beta-N-acetylglucosaminyl)-L-asparaginase